MGLLDFIQAGPQRRQWLDETVGDFVESITPPNLRPAAGLLAQMNPIQGMGDSMQQFGVATDPSRSMEDRRKAAINTVVEGLLAATPAALAAKGYMTPAQGTMEGLLGWSPAGQQVANDIGQFWVDEAGSIPLSGDAVTQRGDEVLGLLSSGRADEVTDAMLDMGDSVQNARLNEYLFNNYDLPMDEASRMARAREMYPAQAAHGSSVDISAVDNERLIGGQFWSTDDLQAIADREVGAAGSGVTIPVNLASHNPAGWREYDQLGVDEILGRGYDSVKLSEGDGASTYITYDPEQVRSRFARFDPRLSHLRNLSAGIGAAGLFGLLSPETEYQGGI